MFQLSTELPQQLLKDESQYCFKPLRSVTRNYTECARFVCL